MDVTISKIKKSGSAEIWVSLREFQGTQYVDIREHFLSGDDHHWHPTKKGIMVKPELLSQVADGIESLAGVTELGTVATIANSSQYEIQIGFREFGGGSVRRDAAVVLDSARCREEALAERVYIQIKPCGRLGGRSRCRSKPP